MAGKNRKLLLEDGKEKLTWRLVDGDIPDTPKDGVVVKVLHAGICHSDVHMSQKGFYPGLPVPIVFGHEISGEVYDIGEDALKENLEYKKGDRVIVFPWGNCTNCPTCRNDISYCNNMTSPTFTGKKYVYGVHQDGGYQQYVLVTKLNVILKVPDSISMDAAALVPCSGITAYNACTNLKDTIDKAIKVVGQAAVAVVGAGGLALWAIQILKSMYPKSLTVIAIDVMDDKLEDAKAQGADKTFKWGIKDTVPEVVGAFVKSTGGFIDGAIDFTGIPDCQMRTYAMLNPGGTLVMIGLSSKNQPPYPINATIIKNITIKGIITGSRAQCREMFDLLQTNKIKPPPITAVTLDDVEKTINLMKENKVRGRHVVKLNSQI